MVNLQEKPANFSSLYATACADERSRAKVPILEDQDDGTALIESMVIIEYLDDLVEVELSPRERANARLFAQLFQPASSYIAILKADEGSEAEAEAVQTLRDGLRALDAYLRRHGSTDGPFLLGNRFSLAETATAPFAQRFATVLPGLRPSLDPKVMMAEDGLDRLAEWMDAVCARASCVATLPPADDLVASYARLIEQMKGGP